MNSRQDELCLKQIITAVRYGVYRKTAPGWSIGPRTIEDHEFVLVDKGKVIICIEDKEYNAEPGMLFYFYPGLVHSLETDDSEPFSFLAVHFNYAFFEPGSAEWSLEEGKPKLPVAIVQKLSNPHPFNETLRKAVEHLNGKLPGWETGARLSLESFIYKLMFGYFRKGINYDAHKKIDMVTKYIHENIDVKIELPVLAKLANVTPDYLSRLFKSYTGHSLIQYIHHYKVQQAKALLIEDNLKIKDIAGMLGYADEFHFSKTFKKIEGVSPGFFKG